MLIGRCYTAEHQLCSV